MSDCSIKVDADLPFLTSRPDIDGPGWGTVNKAAGGALCLSASTSQQKGPHPQGGCRVSTR